MTLPIGSIQDGPLTTTLRDLALSTGWHDLRRFTLAGTEWQIILGHKRRSDPLRAVLPLPLHTTSLHPSSLKAIFSALSTLQYADLPPVIEPLAPSVEELRRLAFKNSNQTAAEGTAADQQRSEAGEVEVGVEANAEAETVNKEIDRDMIYIAIVTADSTVVYYRLSKGIKKPADIPDE